MKTSSSARRCKVSGIALAAALASTGVAALECGAPATRISTIQGVGDASPLAGEPVEVQGVLTAAFLGDGGLRGFFVQEEDVDADDDPRTSEGLFVFAPELDVDALPTRGAGIRVAGHVTEHRGRTEVHRVRATEACSARGPATALALPRDAQTNAEASEGMLVALDPPWVVTSHFDQALFGEVRLAPHRLMNPTQVVAPGASARALAQSQASQEIVLDDARAGQFRSPLAGPDGVRLDARNTLRAGSRVGGLVVLDEAFGSYRLQPVSLAVQGESRPPLPPRAGDARIASVNVANFFVTLDADGARCGPFGDQGCRGATSSVDYGRQLAKLVASVGALDADVVALMEVENNGFGPTSAIASLARALEAEQPRSRWRVADPGRDFVGSDVITTALIYRADRVRIAPGSHVAVLDDAEVARIAPELPLPVFDGDTTNRASIAATFEWRASGERITLTSNHFKSKGPSVLGRPTSVCRREGPEADPNCDQGDGQGFWNARRVAGAHAKLAWLASAPTGIEGGRVVALGDFNAYAREAPLVAFAEAGYADLAQAFIGDDAYSFAFAGRWGTLDYALANAAARRDVVAVHEWHSNADEPRWLDYSSNFRSRARPPKSREFGRLYAADAWRASDHDPLIVDLALRPRPPAGSADLDGDGALTLADYWLLIDALGTRREDARFDARADLDHSGTVDLRDVLAWLTLLESA